MKSNNVSSVTEIGVGWVELVNPNTSNNALIVSERTPGILSSNEGNSKTVSKIFMVVDSNPSTEYGESVIISLPGRGGNERVTIYSDGKTSIGEGNK